MIQRLLFIIILLNVSLSLSQGDSEEGQAPKIFLKNYGGVQKEYESSGTSPSGISINANFQDDYGNIDVRKSSSPSYKDFYLLNKTYLIKVEISGIGRAVNNITIKEKIDPNLKISISPPFPNIGDPFNDLSIKYLENLSNTNNSTKENYSIDYKNNIITIRVGQLKPKYCIRYNFNITSDRIGVFPATTLVRITGDASKSSDIYIPFNIEVRPPTFEAHLEKNSTQVIAGDPLEITYNIIHKSGWCTDPFNLSVTLKNSTNDEYTLFRNGEEYSGERINTSFNTLKYSPIQATIFYRGNGKQLLPEIYVEDQVISIPYDEREIYVYDNIIYRFIEEHGQSCATFIGLLAILISSLAILYSHRDIKISRDEIKIMNNQAKSMNDQAKSMNIQVKIMGEELKIMKSDIYAENLNFYADEDDVPRSGFDYNP